MLQTIRLVRGFAVVAIYLSIYSYIFYLSLYLSIYLQYESTYLSRARIVDYKGCQDKHLQKLFWKKESEHVFFRLDEFHENLE